MLKEKYNIPKGRQSRQKKDTSKPKTILLHERKLERTLTQADDRVRKITKGSSKSKKEDVSSQIVLHKSKSPPLKLKDNISLVSNLSKASSVHSEAKSRSKDKAKKTKGIQPNKEEIVKKLTKPSLHQNKSGLVKCKSANQMIHFKK